MLNRPLCTENNAFEIAKIRQASKRLEDAFDTLNILIRSNIQAGHAPDDVPCGSDVSLYADGKILSNQQRDRARQAIQKEQPKSYSEAVGVLLRSLQDEKAGDQA